MEVTFYPLHYRFLQRLFLLYLSIDEEYQEECDQVIVLRFLQFFSDFFHKDLLADMGQSDFETFWTNLGKRPIIELLITFSSNQQIDVSSDTHSLFDDKSYSDPAELNLEIDKLFQDLEADIVVFNSRRSGKTEKVIFD
jgi:hypothetical protein